MKIVTDDVRLLTTELNGTKLVNKEMLNEVERGLRVEFLSKLKLPMEELVNYLNNYRFKSKLHIQLQKLWQHFWGRLLL